MSDSNNSEPKKQGVDSQAKKDIFTDLLILSLISAAIGLGLFFIMKPFKKESPSDALYSTVLKGDRLGSSRGALVGEIIAAAQKSGQRSLELDEEEEKILKNYEKEFNEGLKKYKQMKEDGDTTVDFVNAVDDNGITPLMRICYSNLLRSDRSLTRDKTRLRFVEQLLSQPTINIQLKDKHGFTALHWAAWSGFPVIAEKLIDSGLKIDQTENNGYTPLTLAALRGNNEVVEMLLKRGAKRDIKSSKGETALDLVKKNLAAYAMRDSWSYKLIYVQSHHEAFEKTRELLDPGYKAKQIISEEDRKKAERSAKLAVKAKELLDLSAELEKEAKAEQEAKEKAEKDAK